MNSIVIGIIAGVGAVLVLWILILSLKNKIKTLETQNEALQTQVATAKAKEVLAKAIQEARAKAAETITSAHDRAQTIQTTTNEQLKEVEHETNTNKKVERLAAIANTATDAFNQRMQDHSQADDTGDTSSVITTDSGEANPGTDTKH
jgi:F0F1-type ATP synthase membrane subunit b/b'